MPVGPARMPLFDHIAELRRRCIIIVVCLFIAVVFLYMVAPQLVEFLKNPISEYLPSGGTLYTTGAFEGFTLKFQVSLFAGVIVTSPVIFWQILAFFLPALKPNERHYVVPTFAAVVFLFVFGMAFCYLFCLGPAFQWLTGESSSIADLLPNATDYIKYVILFLLAFGLAFQLPVVVFYLIFFDILSYKKMRASWRVVYLVLMVFSAVITPDASPVTMFIMFAALIALYECSLLLARVALTRKIKQQEKEDLGSDIEAS